MISAKKARTLWSLERTNTPVMKWINSQVKTAAKGGDSSVKLRIMPAMGFPGMYEVQELRNKGYTLDYDEYQEFIEINW